MIDLILLYDGYTTSSSMTSLKNEKLEIKIEGYF